MTSNPLSFCHELFKDLPLKDVCKILFDLGYDGIELAPFMFHEDIRKMDPEEMRNILNIIDDEGLIVSGLHWLLASPKGLSISSLDNEIWANTKSFFKSIIQFGAEMESDYLIFGSPNQRSLNPNDPEIAAKEYQQAINFFKEMADLAMESDMLIAFEPLGPQTTNFGGTTEDALKIVKEVNHPGFTLMVDTSAIVREQKDPYSLIRSLKDQIDYVHLNDPNQLGPGMGHMDFIPVFKALKENNYRGWISVEPFSDSIPAREIAKSSIEYINANFPK